MHEWSNELQISHQARLNADRCDRKGPQCAVIYYCKLFGQRRLLPILSALFGGETQENNFS